MVTSPQVTTKHRKTQKTHRNETMAGMQLVVGRTGLSAAVAVCVTTQLTNFMRHGSGSGSVAGISLPFVRSLFSTGERGCVLSPLLRLP